MSEFLKYQHIERLNTQETEGITDGICHIFYKIDGTNASVWMEKENNNLLQSLTIKKVKKVIEV